MKFNLSSANLLQTTRQQHIFNYKIIQYSTTIRVSTYVEPYCIREKFILKVLSFEVSLSSLSVC